MMAWRPGSPRASPRRHFERQIAFGECLREIRTFGQRQRPFAFKRGQVGKGRLAGAAAAEADGEARRKMSKQNA